MLATYKSKIKQLATARLLGAETRAVKCYIKLFAAPHIATETNKVNQHLQLVEGTTLHDTKFA